MLFLSIGDNHGGCWPKPLIWAETFNHIFLETLFSMHTWCWFIGQNLAVAFQPSQVTQCSIHHWKAKENCYPAMYIYNSNGSGVKFCLGLSYFCSHIVYWNTQHIHYKTYLLQLLDASTYYNPMHSVQNIFIKIIGIMNLWLYEPM